MGGTPPEPAALPPYRKPTPPTFSIQGISSLYNYSFVFAVSSSSAPLTFLHAFMMAAIVMPQYMKVYRGKIENSSGSDAGNVGSMSGIRIGRVIS